MNKKLLIATVFATLILLVPMTSAVGVSEVNDDCGCQVVNNPYLVKLKMQFSRLEVHTKLLLMLSKHYPEITDKCQELSNEITTLTEMYEGLETCLTYNNRPICDWLWNMVLYSREQSDYYRLTDV